MPARRKTPEEKEATHQAYLAQMRERYAANKEYHSERGRRWRAQNPDRIRINNRRAVVREYGLTLEEYEGMLKAQGGVCAICQREQWESRGGCFAVDHDHSTGKIRGLLCIQCNSGIGQLQDNVEIVERAAAYLRRHK